MHLTLQKNCISLSLKTFPVLMICLCFLIAGGHFMRKLLLDGRRFPKMHLDLQRLLQVFAELCLKFLQEIYWELVCYVDQ
jgi:hypothetical protein